MLPSAGWVQHYVLCFLDPIVQQEVGILLEAKDPNSSPWRVQRCWVPGPAPYLWHHVLEGVHDLGALGLLVV